MGKLLTYTGVAGVAALVLWVGCSTDDSGADASGSVASGGPASSSSKATGSTTGGGDGGMSAAILCNPVTNDGCTEPGAACDANVDGGFECYTTRSNVPICGECDSQNGPYCIPTATCGLYGTCTRFCCEDG